MADLLVRFDIASEPVTVPSGSLLSEAAQLAGVNIMQPCGGQGRCGRCAVQVKTGNVRRRSTLRLSAEDVDAGYALACQTVVEGDVEIIVPPQEKIERRLATDRTAAEVVIPSGYIASKSQTIKRRILNIEPPSFQDQTDDLSRLRKALRQQAGFTSVITFLPVIKKIGGIIRESDWTVTAILDVQMAPDRTGIREYLIDLIPGKVSDDDPIWGVAIDIGTTTVSLWLVDLTTAKVHAQVAEYNGQIARGEDVISRIIYASKDQGGEEMRQLVLDTINELLVVSCKRVKGYKVSPEDIVKVIVAGNSTMIHLLLEVPASSIRLAPFVTAANQFPLMRAHEVGLNTNPLATVDCLPGVASYVGADISAGVLSSGMVNTDKLTLFMDVGTNGEMVLGTEDWLVTCACSAGPAFEGAGVLHGMRATTGAIEEVWINNNNYEPTYRVIGGGQPRGMCGSGLISLLAEMFMTDVIDKAGNLNTNLNSLRIREGERGLEYVVAWADETSHAKDITLTRVDIDNLIRAKAAIYAGFAVLAQSVGVSLEDTELVLIGGSFGKYINVEKAVQIGLLPDLPWERFQFLGNTSVRGAYYALIDYQQRESISEIANRMTYIELSADNSFYDAFMSAMFLPHTELENFPTVAASKMNLQNAVNDPIK